MQSTRTRCTTGRFPRGAAVALGAAAIVVGSFLGGCSSAPTMTKSGFLSSYSNLKDVSDTKMRYIGPTFQDYKSFIVEPIQLMAQNDMKPADKAEISSYFNDSLVKLLKEHGYTITNTAGPGVARVRIAITNLKDSKWWMKLHPGTNLTGAGRGGATMEGEVVDSISGKQIGAVVQAGVGSQFTAFNYSTVSDIKTTIDEWAKQFSARLDELKAGS